MEFWLLNFWSFSSDSLFCLLIKVLVMVPVWGSKLRRWRSVNTASSSASFAGRWDASDYLFDPMPSEAHFYCFFACLLLHFFIWVACICSNKHCSYSMQWRERLWESGAARIAVKLKQEVLILWSKDPYCTPSYFNFFSLDVQVTN